MFPISLIFLFVSITVPYHINCLNSDPLKPKQYFDLSYTFGSDTIYYPGQKEFQLHKDKDRVRGEGYTYSSYTISMAEHGGTHLDAPYHFDSDGWTVDQIPQTNLVDVPASLIDVSKAVNDLERPHEFVLDVKHIIQHETVFKKIPFGGVVLIYTGWSKYWPNKVEYLGWDNSTKVEGILKFPGVSENACKWLINERRIVGIGSDTASIDPGSTKTFPAHVVLADNQVYNLENVANLHLLLNASKHGCDLHLFVLPLKIVGGTGSPTRILAYCKDKFYEIFYPQISVNRECGPSSFLLTVKQHKKSNKELPIYISRSSVESYLILDKLRNKV